MYYQLMYMRPMLYTARVHACLFIKLKTQLVMPDIGCSWIIFLHTPTVDNHLQVPQLLLNHYKWGTSEAKWRRNPWELHPYAAQTVIDLKLYSLENGYEWMDDGFWTQNRVLKKFPTTTLMCINLQHASYYNKEISLSRPMQVLNTYFCIWDWICRILWLYFKSYITATTVYFLYIYSFYSQNIIVEIRKGNDGIFIELWIIGKSSV